MPTAPGPIEGTDDDAGRVLVCLSFAVRDVGPCGDRSTRFVIPSYAKRRATLQRRLSSAEAVPADNLLRTRGSGQSIRTIARRLPRHVCESSGPKRRSRRLVRAARRGHLSFAGAGCGPATSSAQLDLTFSDGVRSTGEVSWSADRCCNCSGAPPSRPHPCT